MAMAMTCGFEGFKAMTSAAPTQINFNSYRNALVNTFEVLGDAGKAMLNSALEVFDNNNNEEVIRAAKALRDSVDHMWEGNEIRYITTLEGLQQAKPTMMNYIMAEPTFKRLATENKIAAYDGDWIDPEPGYYGEDTVAWQNVMQGRVQNDDDGEYFVNYMNTQLMDVEPLSLQEQQDVSHTWAIGHVMMMLEEEDFTSRVGNPIG